MQFEITLSSPGSGFDIALGRGDNLSQKMFVTQNVYVPTQGHEVRTVMEGEGLVFYGYSGLDDDEVQSLITTNSVLNDKNTDISPQRRQALRNLAGLD